MENAHEGCETCRWWSTTLGCRRGAHPLYPGLVFSIPVCPSWEPKVEKATEESINAMFRDMVEDIWNKYHVRVDEVRFDWINASTGGDPYFLPSGVDTRLFTP